MTYDAGNPNLDRHKNVYGEDYLSEEQNVDTFCAVHDNIKHAHRFAWHKQVFALWLLSTYRFSVVIIMLIMKYLYLCCCHLNVSCRL